MQKLIAVALVLVLSVFVISAAEAAPVTTICGSLIRAIHKTNVDQFSFSSETVPTPAPGGIQVTVPNGQTRCVRVRFSAEAECPNNCFVRAVATKGPTTNELNPAAPDIFRFSSDGMNNGTAHSMEWIERLDEGTWSIRVNFVTGNSSFTAKIGPYTTTVEVLE
jgi:hypothetical protein